MDTLRSAAVARASELTSQEMGHSWLVWVSMGCPSWIFARDLTDYCIYYTRPRGPLLMCNRLKWYLLTGTLLGRLRGCPSTIRNWQPVLELLVKNVLQKSQLLKLGRFWGGSNCHTGSQSLSREFFLNWNLSVLITSQSWTICHLKTIGSLKAVVKVNLKCQHFPIGICLFTAHSAGIYCGGAML